MDDNYTMELHSPELLYLFEFYRINKIGGTASPYVNIEGPGIQIPLAITTLLHDKGLNFPFINDNNEWEQHDVTRGPTSGGPEMRLRTAQRPRPSTQRGRQHKRVVSE